MLESLSLQDVGPSPKLDFPLRARINLLAGDNGLGKTFLLDALWWGLTRTWSNAVLTPNHPLSDPQISLSVRNQGVQQRWRYRFDATKEEWRLSGGIGGALSGAKLVIYSRTDGDFSVWDRTRSWHRSTERSIEAIRFSRWELWDGLPLDRPQKISNGLISDWVSWQLEDGEPFALLRKVLHALSPPDHTLIPGEPTRLSLLDARRHPTLKMPYGQIVPLMHASAGIRRIVALAYLLVWTWQEHLTACALTAAEPTREITFLIDEIDAHLHPRWQRRIVPALLEVTKALTEAHEIQVQLIAATHAPLILASLEPMFDEEQDGIAHLELVDGEVVLRTLPWSKQGDVVGWLVSDAFGLRQGRSLDAERAIEAAEAWMRGDHNALPEDLSTEDVIHAALLRVLPGHDPFWPRWIIAVEARQRGGLS